MGTRNSTFLIRLHCFLKAEVNSDIWQATSKKKKTRPWYNKYFKDLKKTPMKEEKLHEEYSSYIYYTRFWDNNAYHAIDLT